jgi:spoIIIJ-associated protein
MNERTTLEIIAPTVEEALAQGLAQLGLPASAVSVEVLDTGNKGLFGLGARQVRVRLTVNRPGDELVIPPAPVQRKPAPAAAPSAPARSRNESRVPRSRPASVPEKVASAPAASAPVAAPPSPAVPVSDDTSMGEISHGLNDPVLDKAEATISRLLFLMGMQAQVSAHYGEARDDRRPIMVDIRGSDLGVLIGRRGETLDAFQYIASLMVGKEVAQFVHLIVDVEGHRDRRQRQLQQLARRMAEQVIKTGRKLTLEPMTASERRVIHMELRDHPAVTTQSSGEEPHRKVTILPKD